MYLDLFKNSTVVLAVVFLVSYAKSRFQDELQRFQPLLFGLTYGFAGLLMMTSPIVPIEGVKFDGRTAFIGLAGTFGGWIGALIAASICLVYRLYLGGIGALSGALSILTAMVIGALFHRWLKKRDRHPKAFELVCLGLVLGIASTLWIGLTLNGRSSAPEIWHGSIFIALFPFMTLVFGLFEVHESERRESDRVLKESQFVFENAQRIGQIGVWIYWADQDKFKLSTQVQRMMGLEKSPRGHLTPEEILALTHPDDVGAMRAQFKMIATGQRPPGAFEFRIVRKDGSIRTISSYEIGSQEGSPLYAGSRVFAGIVQDTTERTELFDQLAHSAKLATIGELASGIGHEINNPLTAALLFTDRIERKLLRSNPQPDAEVLDLLGRLAQRLQGISSMVRSMTSFARLEQHNKKIFDAHGVIMDSVAIFSELAPNGRLSIEIDLLATKHEIHGDPARLQQVLMNLLTNAKDATEGRPAPSVFIRTQDAGGEFEISIKDNGVGMSPEVQNRVFTPFFTTKEKGRGTGLGLSIASSIVSGMNGRIDVRSTPNEGAEFRLLFRALAQKQSTHADLKI